MSVKHEELGSELEESNQEQVLGTQWRAFGGGLVIKTSPSKAGGVGLSPSLGAKTPHAL